MMAIVAGLSVVIYNMSGSILLTLICALLMGGAFGIVNGLLVGVVEMPAFIVTLATMLIYRSIAQYLCQHLPKNLIGGGSSVYKMDSGIASYQSFYGFGNGKLATVPVVGIILILMTALFVYLSTSTKFGKKVYAIGSNQKAAAMAGINVSLTKMVVFVIAGVLVGLGAFLWIAMNASADPATTGNSYEMYAIASVVLGGISMSGGKGKCLGVLFGAMSYTIIDKIIVALKMDSLINDAIKGVILIVVILIQVAGPKLKEKFGR
jgi:ribose transport system permease protein